MSKLGAHSQIKRVVGDECLTASYLTAEISDPRGCSRNVPLHEDSGLLCSSCDLGELMHSGFFGFFLFFFRFCTLQFKTQSLS